MKSMFQKLHRTAWIAFTLMSILMVLYLFLFGPWPALLVGMWLITLGLIIMVILGCIVQTVDRHRKGNTLWKLPLRYLLTAAGVFAALVLLDTFADSIAWLENLQAGLIFGFMGLYEPPK